MSVSEEKINLYEEGPYHWFLPQFYARKRERLVELIHDRLKPDDVVLDLGCGDGRLTSLVSSHVRTVVGLDNQMLPLQFARLLIRHDNVRLCCADGRALSFRADSFDLVACFDTIEHIPLGLVSLLFDEVRRVLRPGGLFIVSTPNSVSLDRRLWGRAVSPKHYFEYSPDELQQALCAHGYGVERVSGIYVPPPVMRRYLEHYASVFPFKHAFRVLIHLGARLPGWSETQLVVARAGIT